MDSKGDNAPGRGGGDNDNNDGGKHPVKNQLPTTQASIASIPTSTTSQSDIAQATRNSLRDAVGAFPVAGPGIESNNTNNSSSMPSASFSSGHNYTNDNLPPNIDIIAEATLVVQEEDDPAANDNETATGVDTLGLRWDDEARLGGAADDSASVAISAITTPYTPAPHPSAPSVTTQELESNPQALPNAQVQNSIDQSETANRSNATHAVTANGTSGDTTTTDRRPSINTAPAYLESGNYQEEPIQAEKIDKQSVYICGKSFRFEKWHLLLLVVVGLTIIIVPTAVVLTNNKNKEDETIKDEGVKLVSTEDESEEEEYTSFNWTREEIESIVAPSVTTDMSLLEVPESPQSRAIDWLSIGGGTDIITGPTKLSVEWQVQQRYVLAVLYYSTNGEQWKNQYDYLNNDKHECDWGEMLNNGWPSIECDEVEEEEDGYTKRKVALINICEYIFFFAYICAFDIVFKLTYHFIIHPTITGQNNVAGELPAELASLDLRTIDLLTNKISGSIPPELYTMKNLEYLNLGYNQITGTVASELGDLNKLSECTSLCILRVCS